MSVMLHYSFAVGLVLHEILYVDAGFNTVHEPVDVG
jgi:hypothetical protein